MMVAHDTFLSNSARTTLFAAAATGDSNEGFVIQRSSLMYFQPPSARITTILPRLNLPLPEEPVYYPLSCPSIVFSLFPCSREHRCFNAFLTRAFPIMTRYAAEPDICLLALAVQLSSALDAHAQPDGSRLEYAAKSHS